MTGAPFHNREFWDQVWELPGPWVNEAACATAGMPDAWFPDKGDPSSVFAVAAAKRICDRCPVRRQCLDYAMRHEHSQYRYGIYGGLTPGARRKLGRQARAAS